MKIRVKQDEYLEYDPGRGDFIYAIGCFVYLHDEQNRDEHLLGEFMCDNDAKYVVTSMKTYHEVFHDYSDYLIPDPQQIHNIRLLVDGVDIVDEASGMSITYIQ